MKNRKGQITIIAIVMTFLSLFVYAAFLPVINSVINLILPNADSATTLLAQSIPFIILVTIVIALLNYAQPSYEMRR